MKIKNLLFKALIALTICMPFASCSNNEENIPNDNGSKIELPQKRAYILYEGSFGHNNSGIAFYAPNKDADFQSNIFKLQNGKEIGSLAQDIIEYNDHIYVVVSGSKYISMLNEACVEVKTFRIPDKEGDPRHIVANDGFLYVTQYGGHVSKIDANTLERAGVFKGGDNLEGIAEYKGKLYVANTYKIDEDGKYIYNDEVFVVNAKTMELETTLKVGTNPERLFDIDGKIYVYSKGNYADIPNTLQVINPSNNYELTNYEEPMSKIAEGKNGLLYLINNVTIYDENWNVVSSENQFKTFNSKTGEFGDSFLKNIPEELKSATIYLLNMDDETNDIYLGTTDYTNTGTIYRFDENGNLKETFNAGGINPNNMIFLD